MKISLMYELQVMRPWHEGSEEEVFRHALEQAILADKLGFHCVWLVEHHFLSEFSHSSAPEVFLGALSQATERIRLGHSVVVLPYNHPIRVAERIATLDLLSGGRVEFGTGRSVTEEELGGFGLDPAESLDRWREAVGLIPRLFQPGTVSFQGKHYSIHDREVFPKPKQKPHPRMYRACTQPKSWREAGEDGLGALGFTLATDPESLGRRVDEYRAGLRDARPVGEFVIDWAGVFTLGLAAESDEAAREAAEEGIVYYMDRSFAYYTTWGRRMLEGHTEDVPESYRWYAEASLKTHAMAQKAKYENLQENFMILSGRPERILEGVRRYEAVGVDEILFLMQVGRTKHEDIMRSIELIGKEVIPAVSGS